MDHLGGVVVEREVAGSIPEAVILNSLTSAVMALLGAQGCGVSITTSNLSRKSRDMTSNCLSLKQLITEPFCYDEHQNDKNALKTFHCLTVPVKFSLPKTFSTNR